MGPALKLTAAALAVKVRGASVITRNFQEGTLYPFLFQMLQSYLNILAMYWAGPEAEKVTEPMLAM